MDQLLADIGLVLKRLRKSNDLTQGDLGKMTGYSQAAISAYEAGDTEPGYLFLKKVRGLFGYDLLAENISKLIFEKRWDKELGIPLWTDENEKSGPSQVPDPHLLTQLKLEAEALQLSLQKLIESTPGLPDPGRHKAAPGTRVAAVDRKSSSDEPRNT